MKLHDICAQDLLTKWHVLYGYYINYFFKTISLQQIMGQCVSESERSKQCDRSRMPKSSYKIEDFKLLKVIGRGGFSRVWKVEEKKSGRFFALKVMSKAKIIAKKSVKAVLLERIILTRLREAGSSSIVNMIASFQDDTNLYLLMDYLQGHSLRHHLNNGLAIAPQQIKSLIYALLKALQYLYNHRVVHRDIKPENILFNGEGIPFLTDFGIASYNEDEVCDSNSGTLGYMSPEVIQSQSHSYTADYYAIGVIAFQLFLKHRPFASINKEDLLKEMCRIVVNGENFPQLGGIPAQACDFIVRLLERKARRRLGHEGGISELLEHPWFSCLHSDSSDPIQLNYIKFPLSNPQNSLSLSLEEELSAESADTQMNEQNITKLLRRDHVQDMFRSFNSMTNVAVFTKTRRRSEKIERMETDFSLKKVLTTSK